MISKKYPYYKELQLAKKLVKQSYKKIYLKTSMDVRAKGIGDLVTNIDIMTEQFILNGLQTAYPHDFVVSEEGHPSEQIVGRCWVLDPIDGTINFANNIQMWGTQLAFVVDGKPEFCVMYLPYLNEFYYAAIGYGAYLNDKPMPKQVPQAAKDFMSIVDFVPKYREQGLKNIEQLDRTTLKVRLIGCCCYSYCKIAKGDYGSMVLYCDTPWDYLPGTILCHECGVDVYTKIIKENKGRATLVTFCPETAKLLRFSKKMYK